MPDTSHSWCPTNLGCVATFSSGIAKIPQVEALIGCDRLVLRPKRATGIDAVVGWGHKNNTIAAIRFAHAHKLPYWRLEDGFLRSVGLGVNGDRPLSMVLDDQGMYYDARRPSRLEAILTDEEALTDSELLARADRAMDAIRQFGLSKYNSSPIATRVLEDSGKAKILVVDQTAGDLSVACGLGSRDSFQAMLAAALEENPDAEILVKTHPDVIAGKKQGYLGKLDEPRVQLLSMSCNPIRLLQQVDRVYVVTSQLGFEALVVGLPVTCFGAPFYAGWGLTDDRRSVERRGVSRSLRQLFAAAYLVYSRYLDPDTGQSTDIETVINYLALQRREFARNQGRIFCFGFRFWKHRYVRAYLRCPGNTVFFADDAAEAKRLGFDSGSKALIWGQRAGDDVAQLAKEHGVEVWRMEDGFLRSIGLGSDMTSPASLVVDREGIYYDPRQPSELESILQSSTFDDALLRRASELRARILETGLSKYNVGHEDQGLGISPGTREVVLVPGQVEDDASIVLGCRDICTNLELLEAARAACPDAFLIFKPHPDVLSGNRRGMVPENKAFALCDHIEEDASLAQCLAVAAKVHTMTSLVGFEALLRGLEVHAYGQPFYSGWGLTHDRHPVERRTRKLSLDELVAGAYLLYPRYLNRESYRFTTAEAVIDRLRSDRDKGGQPLKIGWSRRQLRKLRHIALGVLHAS